MRKSYLNIRILALVLILFTGYNSFSQFVLADPTFGSNGRVITEPPFSNYYGMQANEIVVQPDGKLIIVSSSYYDLNVTDTSRFTIIRYNPDGTLDTTFGTGGISAITMGSGYRQDIATTLALQPDGKIIAAGYTRLINASTNSVLVRLTSHGTPDSTFGINGIVISNQSISNDYFYTMTIKPDGKILAAGSVNGATATQIVQFDSTGKVDSTFGLNGLAAIAPVMIVAKVELQPDGKIIAGGYMPNTDTMSIVRFLATGQPDNSFGNAGRAYTLFAYGKINSMTLQPDGKMILIGRHSNLAANNTQVAMARFNHDGSIDSAFGNKGRVFSLGGIDQGYRVIIRPDGKLLVAASKDKGFSYSPPVNGNFAMLKYYSNGTLEKTFGRNGVVITDLAGTNDEAYCAVLQPDGKIVMAGFTKQNGKNKIALLRYQSGGSTHYNTIYATTFYDKNVNGIKDTLEPYFTQAGISTIKPFVDTIYTNSEGDYTVETDTGNYVTRVKPYSPYYTVIPSQLNTSHTTYFNNDSVMFAVQPIAGKRDVEVQLIPLDIARPGFPVRYKILVRNNGTDTTVRDTIQLIKSKNLTFNSAFPIANSIKGDTLRWVFANLKPLDTLGIQLYLTVKAPPILNIGDTLISVVTVDSLINDLVPENDTAKLVQIATGAFDPNDKAENHGGKIALSNAIAGEYLTYNIRFQNTGNDTAFNVYIRDTLDTKLDWNSLQIVASSHNYQMTINDGKCLLTFPFIMLVDSIKNEPQSHGYIVYKIKTLQQVQLGDVIKNTAAIYFDYNLPIFTNTEMTTVVADVLPLRLLSFIAKKQEKTNLLNWSTANEINVDRFEVERSSPAVGGRREFSKIGTVKAGSLNYTFADNTPLATTNHYRIKMIDKDGSFSYSPVRLINNNNNSSFTVAIYPNPAKDKLQIQITSDKPMALQMQVVSLDGKILISNSSTANEANTLRSINISSLQRGSYLLKVSSENKEEQVIKFEKL